MQASIPQNSPLLALPAEIRNDIWTLVVVENDSIIMTKVDRNTIQRHISNMPGITHTSHQTRSESLPIYLDQNTFRFDTSLAQCCCQEQRLFGPLIHHLPSTRRIEFRHWAQNQVYQFVRDGDWANVALEIVMDGTVVRGHKWSFWLEDFARSKFKSAMKNNSDGMVHPEDFSHVAAYVD